MLRGKRADRSLFDMKKRQTQPQALIHKVWKIRIYRTHKPGKLGTYSVQTEPKFKANSGFGVVRVLAFYVLLGFRVGWVLRFVRALGF